MFAVRESQQHHRGDIAVSTESAREMIAGPRLDDATQRFPQHWQRLGLRSQEHSSCTYLAFESCSGLQIPASRNAVFSGTFYVCPGDSTALRQGGCEAAWLLCGPQLQHTSEMRLKILRYNFRNAFEKSYAKWALVLILELELSKL